MKINWQAFFTAVVRLVVRWHLVIIIVATIAAIVAFPRTKQLYSNIDTDLANLLPEDYESVKTIWKVRDKFKALAGMILVLEGPSVEETQDVLKDLAVYLDRDPLITDVMYEKPGYDFFEKYALLFIDLEDLEEIDFRIDRRIQKEKLGGLYIDFEEEGEDDEFKFGDIEDKYRRQYSSGATNRYYASDSGLLYTIYIKPVSETEGIKGQKAFYHHVREIVDAYMANLKDPRFTIYYTGSVRTRVEEYGALLHDLATAGIISGLGIAFVLLLFFRRIFAVFIMLLPLAFGILMTFAFASLFFDSLNLITSFLFMILGGLGIEIGIHLVSRYIEERRAGTDMQQALFTVLYHTGGSALTSALTVAASFMILVINDFKGFSEFGFIAGTGLIINYISYMVLLPSLLVLAEKLRLLALKRSVGFVFATTASPTTKTRFPYPRFTLAGIAVLLVVAALDIPQLQFEWKFKQLKAVIPAHEIAKGKQRETSKSVNSPALVIIHNKEEADAVKRVIKEKKNNKADTVINAYKSYFDLNPDDQTEKLEVVRRMQKRLEDDTIRLVKGEHKRDLDRFKDQLVKTVPVNEGGIPDDVKKLFWGDEMNPGEQVAYINPLTYLEMDDGRNAIRFSEEIGVIETPGGTFYPSSDALVFADVLRTMMRDGKRAILLAFLCVFVIVYLDFRSLKITAMVVSPIALGVVFMALFMYVFKIKFNFYNMVIAPTVVGTSIDNSVHLYHRYKELGLTNLMAAVRSTGGAALLSSATNICGFLGLAFVNHMGLKSIGNLAILGMSACLLTTLVFFPALLQFLEDRRAKKSPQQW